MADTRKKYSREFKIQAVRLLKDGEKSGQQIEKELGIGAGQVHRWRRELEAEGERDFGKGDRNCRWSDWTESLLASCLLYVSRPQFPT